MCLVYYMNAKAANTLMILAEQPQIVARLQKFNRV